MSPITHFLISWDIANIANKLDRRERLAITLAGILPDIDGIGIIVDAITSLSSHPTNLFSTYHHLLGHNLGFALLVTVSVFLFTGRQMLVRVLVFVSFHLHLFCDLAGSRSPDGYQWAIRYFLPFSDSLHLVWVGQWELNAWQNFLITGIALFSALTIAVKLPLNAESPHLRSSHPQLIEFLSKRYDTAFRKILLNFLSYGCARARTRSTFCFIAGSLFTA